jgi:hypothetical protein
VQQGECKLCLKKRPLCKSHLIPRAVYALCRATKAKNPNPFLLTYKFAMQSSRQVQIPLLCHDCEQLLCAKGEAWMVPQLARYGGPFPVLDTLIKSPALFIEPDFIAYVLAAIPAIRVPDLIHFFMGIFWKASVHPWAKARTEPWLSFGNQGEAIRQFLLGVADFPAQMALSVTVLPPPVTLIAFHIPYDTIGPDPTYHLYISGINCTLWMGPNIPVEIVAGSIHRPPHHLLVVDNAADITRKFREAGQSVMKSRAPRSH